MKKLLLAALLAAGASAGRAQTFPPAMGARFQAILDSVVQEPGLLTTTNQDTVGVTMAVSIPGLGTWEGVAGPAQPGVPMTTNMTAAIGSCSKLYTAVILLKLQEAGILELDQTIGHWLPMNLHDVDTSATIRQLLHHETGIYDFLNDDVNQQWVTDVYADPAQFWDYDRVMDSIGAPHFSKGTAYRYSNTNYMLSAWIIQQATGHTLSYNLHQYITTPLNLTRTYEYGEESAIVDAEEQAFGEVYGTYFPGCGSVALGSMTRGGGSIVSTPKDVAAFYQALLNGSFLTAASKAQLLDMDPASQYGLGIGSEYSGGWQLINLGHTGSIAGFNSEAAYDPLTGATFFLAVNSLDAGTFPYARPVKEAMREYFPKEANDAGISLINAPHGVFCNGSVTPAVQLTNHGSSALTSVAIGYRIDGGAVSSFSWSGTLVPGATAVVTLPALSTTVSGDHTFSAWTKSPNGATEGYAFNDTLRSAFRTDLATAHPGYISEDFESGTTGAFLWNLNPRIAAPWGITKLTGASGNHSLMRNSWMNAIVGEESYADMPPVSLTAGSDAELTFRYAHATYPGTADTMQVLLSTDCGATWTSVFYKGGLDLSQNLESSTDDGYWSYFPHTAAEWHQVTVPLSAYSGDMMVRFRQVNSFGEHLFLDAVTIGSATSVAGAVASPAIRLYPNPASSEASVTGLPAGTPIRLTTLTGQTILEATAGSGKTTLDISRLAPGMYLVNTPLGTRKLVKQ